MACETCERMRRAMKRPKFVIFQDAAGQWRWHLRSANGRVICQGEAHTRKPDAVRACRTVANTAFAARVVA